MRRIVFVLAVALLLAMASGAWAGIEKLDQAGEAVQMYCIEGYVFVYARGSGDGYGVALVQVQEERDGTVVPMRCPEKKK